jgi:hypothetical protein
MLFSVMPAWSPEEYARHDEGMAKHGVPMKFTSAASRHSDPWTDDYMKGIHDFNKGIVFDQTQSGAWQSGWNSAREDDAIGLKMAVTTCNCQKDASRERQ